jgi:hypothetical protein
MNKEEIFHEIRNIAQISKMQNEFAIEWIERQRKIEQRYKKLIDKLALEIELKEDI